MHLRLLCFWIRAKDSHAHSTIHTHTIVTVQIHLMFWLVNCAHTLMEASMICVTKCYRRETAVLSLRYKTIKSSAEKKMKFHFVSKCVHRKHCGHKIHMYERWNEQLERRNDRDTKQSTIYQNAFIFVDGMIAPV